MNKVKLFNIKVCSLIAVLILTAGINWDIKVIGDTIDVNSWGPDHQFGGFHTALFALHILGIIGVIIYWCWHASESFKHIKE